MAKTSENIRKELIKLHWSDRHRLFKLEQKVEFLYTCLTRGSGPWDDLVSRENPFHAHYWTSRVKDLTRRDNPGTMPNGDKEEARQEIEKILRKKG